jgi:hypothetical protein
MYDLRTLLERVDNLESEKSHLEELLKDSLLSRELEKLRNASANKSNTKNSTANGISGAGNNEFLNKLNNSDTNYNKLSEINQIKLSEKFKGESREVFADTLNTNSHKKVRSGLESSSRLDSQGVSKSEKKNRTQPMINYLDLSSLVAATMKLE